MYDSWGKLVSIKDGSGVDKTTDTTFIGYKNPYRYRGYRYDNETGLYYLNSRYYNPDWGRFINADGLAGATGAIGTHNMYSYCLNNPVMRSDPSGFWSSDEYMSQRHDIAWREMLAQKERDNEKSWPTGNKHMVDDYPKYSSGGSHKGTDIAKKSGTKIVAAAGGKVIEVHNPHANNYNTNKAYTGKPSVPDFGNYVKIEGYDGAIYTYAHMQQDINLSVGQRVVNGSFIGYVGNTGNSTGAHLHFEVYWDGYNRNPEDFLPKN